MLEQTISGLERSGADSTRVLAALEPLVGDSVRLVRSEISSDPTLRRLPGVEYAPICNERLAEDASGFTLFPPNLLSRRTDVRFARDLHGRDSVLLAGYDGAGLPAQAFDPGRRRGPAVLSSANRLPMGCLARGALGRTVRQSRWRRRSCRRAASVA